MSTTKHIKLDERNHVEKPLLAQLNGSSWSIIGIIQDFAHRQEAHHHPAE